MINCYIINYNLLSWPRAMCDKLATLEGVGDIIILDNNSNYEPLLDWYKSMPYKVINLNKNYGHNVMFEHYGINNVSEYYVLSDPDLDIDTIPNNTLLVLKDLLDTDAALKKAGLGLQINNYPDTAIYKDVAVASQQGFWVDQYKPGWWRAHIDTTFYLGKREYGIVTSSSPSVRGDSPYWCKHLPYYVTKDNITPEYMNYLKTCHDSSSMRNFMLKEGLLSE